MTKKFFIDDNGFAAVKKPKGKAVSTIAVNRDMIPIKYFETPADLLAVGGIGHTMILDIECFWNYFLIGFMHKESNRYIALEITPDGKIIDLNLLNWIIWNFRLISFNGIKYDIPLLLLALRGYDSRRLKECSNTIVGNKEQGINSLTPFEIAEKFGLRYPAINHIDLIEVCPLDGSLKKYAARLHAKRIQDLPYDHNKELTYDEAEFTKNYCLGSDIPATNLILDELEDQIKLRYELTDKYKVDLRSKSDAQIAESVFAEEIKRITGKKINDHTIKHDKEFQYIVPNFIRFQTPLMKKVLDDISKAKFKIDGAGAPMWPEGLGELEKDRKSGKTKWILKVNIGNSVYTMGMGGLHSNEKCSAHIADDNCEIHDDDVESFYPKIILNQGLYPKHLGEVFLSVYKVIVDSRVSAKGMAKKCKDSGDKEGAIKWKIIADSLKIVINGSFGKLGSFWSKIYAPDLMIQVTLSGQLCLLMLIEALELNGIPVVSANTDGIVTKPPKNLISRKDQLIKDWEEWANFKTERTNYSAVYSRDINNYIAVKIKDSKTNEIKLKFKGAYLNPWNDKELAIFRFHKNPKTTICIEAVEQLIINKIPLEQTIKNCTDIIKFVSVQNVNGGAHKDGVFLGKVARWYYANDIKGQINAVNNSNKVSDTEGASPLMDLPDTLPNDINYNWYIEKANAILYDIGFYKRSKIASLFN